MAVLNRCAIAVAPRGPMREWSRAFWTREDMEGFSEEPSLYLIPTYESEEEAQGRLRERHRAIFEAELELWCMDRSFWPAARGFDTFLDWFEVQFFPLVEDLGVEALRTYPLATEFQDTVRRSLD